MCCVRSCGCVVGYLHNKMTVVVLCWLHFAGLHPLSHCVACVCVCVCVCVCGSVGLLIVSVLSSHSVVLQIFGPVAQCRIHTHILPSEI